ncbi:response regulator [Nocardioides marinus]|nr:response regulator [Nocardioides marinus]
MNSTNDAASGPLASFYMRYDPAALLQSYATGRVRTFWARQFCMFAAFAVLALVAPPILALLAFAISLAGDVLDTLLLSRVGSLLRRGMRVGHLQWLSCLTGLVQAMTFSVAALAPYWIELPNLPPNTHNGPLFTVGLVLGAALNTGMVMPYNPRAVFLKLGVYAALPVLMLVHDFITAPSLVPMHYLHLGGLLVLYVSGYWFLQFILRNFDRGRERSLAQAQQQEELEQAHHRLTEQQMQARRLALVAQNAHDSVMLMDREGRITWVNDSFTRLSGYTFEEAVGTFPGDLLNGPDTDPETIRKLQQGIRTAQPVRIEVCNRRKDGQDIWIETSQVPVLNRDGELESLLAVERDVTAAKRHAQQLEEARIAAEEGDRAKADFLATMSHEIRTPMNGVVGMAQLLRDSGLNAEQKSYADAILSSADTLLALINDVLDYSKMEAEGIVLNCVDFDLHACFRSTVRLLQPQAEAKGLELVLEIGETVPRRLHGDDRRIRQILMNLLGNAIKFTPEGRVRVILDLDLTAAAAGDAAQMADGPQPVGVVFSVADTGIGIAPEHLDSVFERFSQADAAISRRFGGTGLGLTISRGLAEAMGGGIAAQSTLGEGTCFTVQLMLQPCQAAPVPHAAMAEVDVGELPSLKGLRVLVAEDNLLNRKLVEKFLRSVDVDLLFAENGRAAVQQFEATAPDVILMDMSMPEMDGLEATRAIRRLPLPQPSIVALTANAFASDREACLAAGMDDFMSKPVSRRKLVELLEKLATRPRCAG